jgi:DNA-binding IclR family transcriptional regulator
MPKTKGKEIQRRVATIYAVSYLAQRPYRASELAEVLGLNLRTTYRILSDLRASNWLIKENLTYSIQPNQIQTQNHENTSN